MSKLTLKEFLEYNPKIKLLAMAVKRQLGSDTNKEFFEKLRDVIRSSYGANAGFTGFIYYSDTSKFFQKNRKIIIDFAINQAKEIETDGCVMTMVMNFNSLKDKFTQDEIGRALFGKYDDDFYLIYDSMAKYALEEVANEFEYYEYSIK